MLIELSGISNPELMVAALLVKRLLKALNLVQT